MVVKFLVLVFCCCDRHKRTATSKYENISPVHSQILEGAKVHFFRRRKNKYIVFHSHFQKFHLCNPLHRGFVHSFFGGKIKGIDHRLLFHQEWFTCGLILRNFSNKGTFPRTLQTMLQQSSRKSFLAAFAHADAANYNR